MSLFPKEHGAYGQITFPILTALLVAGVSTPGLLFATAVLAGFLAHEPAAILVGARGARAKHDLRQLQSDGLDALSSSASAGVGAWLTLQPALRSIAAYPPAPTHLRTLGWTLLAVSVITAAIIVAVV